MSDVKILDPIWTTAYIVRNHGYMVYDTLLAVDDKLAIKPQMLEGWKVSDDKLTYTFTLRDGLKFHDGQPVTAEDCIASIKRWARARRHGPEADALHQGADGRRRQDLHPDPEGALRPGAGIARQAELARCRSSCPSASPRRRRDSRSREFIGSGPFVFRKDLWRPGEKVVYDKFNDYKPRAEPPSGLAGGKIVYRRSRRMDRHHRSADRDQRTDRPARST